MQRDGFHPKTQDLTEENAQLVLGEKASHLASAAQALPFVPYHPDELRQRGHRKRPGLQTRYVCSHSAAGCAPLPGSSCQADLFALMFPCAPRLPQRPSLS